MHRPVLSFLLAWATLFAVVIESRPVQESSSASLPALPWLPWPPWGSWGWPWRFPLGSQQPTVSIQDVQLAYDALQQWYDQSLGLWLRGGGWWNSANCLTVVADLAAIQGPLKQQYAGVFSNTYNKAPLYNLNISKDAACQANGWMIQSYYPANNLSPELQKTGFLDGFYDDEGWWALAWIRAYDVTGDQNYLTEAEDIFDDMYQVFGKANCSKNSGGVGGIWWDKAHTYVNAIANELFLDVAANLANRVQPKRDYYLNIAKQQWSWFKASGMINAQNTINDGLQAGTCRNNGGTVWSYNQGVILGGLTALSLATGDKSYIAEAQKIADAAIAALSKNGILHDVCEPNCGPDGNQFKGVFTRNLGYLNAASPQSRYATFLRNNANSIWAHDRDPQNQLSLIWSGPFVNPANASTHSSAMDTLVAALAS